MIPREDPTPELLRPIAHWGVDLSPAGGSGDWRGDCPFCGKRGHLYASPTTGQWDCKVCGATGNVLTMLRRLAADGAASTTREAWAALARERGVPAGVLRARGLALVGGAWAIPSPSPARALDLRRFADGRTQSTAGCKSQLFGSDELAAADPRRPVYLMEGEWDAMAMDWLLRDAGDKGPSPTPVVVAVPGATVMKPAWVEALRGRRVVTFYDADDAGDKGQLRAAEKLAGVAAEVKHACWPDESPDGWDVRDHARERVPKVGAVAALGELLALVGTRTRRRAASDGGGPSDSAPPKWREEDLPEVSFDAVVREFSKFLSMNDEAVLALKLSLAVCLSNDIADDPLWMYVVAPPSAGKTEILAQLQESGRCVFVSSVTPHGLVSGWRGEGKKDPSLIPKLKGKTLVAKDFTEVLSLPEREQNEVYSVLRGAYDGMVDRAYGNGVTRTYRDCHFSIIAGSTQAIRLKRGSMLGERFLQFEMRSPSREESRARSRARRRQLGGKRASGEAMQKAVAAFLKKRVRVEDLPSEEACDDEIDALAELIARMRAEVPRNRYTGELEARIDPEGITRVALQLAQLGRILAWIDGARAVGPRQMAVVRRVAFDTAGGFNTEIVAALMRMGGRGTKREAADGARLPFQTATRRMDDLILMRVLVPDGTVPSGQAGGRPAQVLRVADDVVKLWLEATGENKGAGNEHGEGGKGAGGGGKKVVDPARARGGGVPGPRRLTRARPADGAPRRAG